MRSLLLFSVLLFSILNSSAQISVNPNSGCAGTSFGITITNGSGMNSSSSACGVSGGITPAGGGGVILSGSSFSSIGFSGTSTSGTLNIPSNFTPGLYGFSITVCGTTYSCSNCFTVLGKPTNVSLTPSGVSQICAGATNIVTCNATGATSFQWKLNGNNINLATSSTYNANAAGTYTCDAINSCGNTLSSNSVSVTVNTAPSNVQVSPNGNLGFCTGDNLLLTCTSIGGTGYQWVLNGNDLIGQTSNTYTATASGIYTCKAGNTCGLTPSSNNADITVETAPLSASISPSGSVSICQGTGQILTCNSNGAISYQWKKDGNDISGATSSTYNASSDGVYTCEAFGLYCMAASSNNATVTTTTNPTPPSLTSTLGTSFCIGDTTIISAPQGFSSYNWSSGATTSNISVSASGNYTVTVNSNCGTVASTPLTITVNDPGTPSITQNGETLIAVSGTAVSYQWLFNGNEINGATNSSFTATESGSYSVEITDANGCVAESSPLNVTIIGIGTLYENDYFLKLVPNPATSTVTIFTSLPSAYTIKMLDVYGQIIYNTSTEGSSHAIAIEMLSSGIYFIQVESTENVITKQFIKE